MNRRLITFLILILLLLGGCLRNNARDHFYMLRPLTPTESPQVGTSHKEGGPVIGLGPIRVANYLERPQIVTAVSEQEYKLAEDHRWAERLDETIPRVLAENLSVLVPTEHIILYPWIGEQKMDAQVTVTIQELYVDPTGQVRLVAPWTVRRGGGTALNRKSLCQRLASSTDYQRIVAAQSECLGELSREIANSLRALLGSTK